MSSVAYRTHFGHQHSRLDFDDEFCNCGHRKTAHTYAWQDASFRDCGAWRTHKLDELRTDCDCCKFIPMDWITAFCVIPERIWTK